MSEKKSEQAVPVQEIKTPTVISVKKFMKSVLVVLLSFVCICVGVLIYQLHEDFHPVYGKTERENMPQKTLSPVLVKKAPVAPVRIASEQKKDVAQMAQVEKTEKQPVTLEKPMMSMPMESKIDTLKTVSPEEPKKEIVPEPTAEKTIVTEKVLPLSVALGLRDKLIMGETCVGELSLLMSEKLPEKADKTKILNALIPVCTDASAYSELKTLFNQEKKGALTTFYRMTSSNKWTAYMKAVWTTLVDVRRLNPVKKRPKDIVSLAQNALNQYNVAEAIILVETLPPEMQADFQGFLGQAKAYILAQEAVDSLVFAYEMGGK